MKKFFNEVKRVWCNIFCDNIVAVFKDGYVNAVKCKNGRYALVLRDVRLDMIFNLSDCKYKSRKKARVAAEKYIEKWGLWQ